MSQPTPPAFRSPYAPPGTPADPRHAIHYATDGVQPPSAVYLDVNDVLSIQLNTIEPNIALQTRYRILEPDGQILLGAELDTSTNATATPQTFTHPLPEGFLLSLYITATSTPGGSPILQRGLTRVKALIVRGGNLQTHQLANGGLDNISQIAWPNGANEPACSGQGSTRSITGTGPAAGAEITEVTPTLRRWQVKAFRFQLTTSAAVANRGVTFVIDDGTNVLYAIEAPSTQAASLSQLYNLAIVSNRQDKVFSNNITMPLPASLALQAGYRIRTVTSSLQAGDQYIAPQYEVEEWFTLP